ncbi:S9 family peptidase [Parasphingorhabdus litoris]|uniref:S9 family peptidase n=1 Tax=Parasphingorhabdus litoris TaxID=394733 RepID=A0ABN1AY75_9SPHN|nr:S9 family peptidase [Parasphingorhabdus litoris]
MGRYISVISVFIILIFAGTSSPTRAQTPLEHFAALPLLNSPKLSPSGDRYAALIAAGGRQIFMISPILTSGPKRVALDIGELDMRNWRWVNEDWLIANIADVKKVQGQDWLVTRAVAIKADGSSTKVLVRRQAAQNGGDILWTAKDGRPEILLGYQTSIYSNYAGFWAQVDHINLETGKKKTVVKPKVGVQDWYADQNGNVRMGIGRSNSSLTSRLYYREKNGKLFKVMDRAKRKKGEGLTVPTLFLAEPGKALVFDDKDGTDALYEYDLNSLTIGEKLHAVDGYDIDYILTNAEGNGLIGYGYTDTRRKVEWLDPTLKELQQALDNSVPNQTARIISRNRDHTRFIVFVGNASRPGKYYLFDTRWGQMKKMGVVNDHLENRSYAPVKTIRYKARDGLSIEAILTVPKGRATENLPLIMMPHGGPFARDRESWDWWAQFLADRGYAVLQPNYRGSSGYGVAFALKGEGQWGLAMQDDLDDGVKWAIEQGIADPERVCIVGASYGGYAAMRAAHRNPEIYKCAISYAGVSDLQAMVNYDRRYLNSKWSRTWVKEQAPDLRSVSPIHYASEVQVPLLLMHGRKDQRVKVSQSRRFAKALTKAQKPFRYVEQEEGDHHFSLEADRVQFLQEMEAFLAQHIPVN